jgi:hypothetical protein
MDSDRTASRGGRQAEAGSLRAVPSDGGRRPVITSGHSPTDPGSHERGVGANVLELATNGTPEHRSNSSTGVDQMTRRRSVETVVGPRRDASPAGPVVGARAGPKRRRWRLRVAYAAVVVVLAAAVAVGISNRAHLHRTDAEVATTRAQLRHALVEAHRAESTLAAVSAQAATAAHVLATETAQLTSVQSQLASTESDVFANGISINDLDVCLSGVERALNQISLDDQNGAAATLDGVAESCRGAAPSS